MPLAVEFSKKFVTIGYDKNENRVEELKNSIDKTLEVNKNDLLNSSIIFTTKIKEIENCDIYIVTVPTPVNQFNSPDMTFLSDASEVVGKVLEKGNIVIYESTVYPGATEEFCVPILEKTSNLIYNKDFFCGYSPERINPGDKKHTLSSITKITSGSNKETANLIDKIYSSIIPAGTHKVSSIKVAEAAKVIENIQRDVNIALINELALIFNKLSINTNEVLTAAGTKWNFLPFKPGLVGGHCIGVDPYYLTHKAKELGYHPEIILAGRRINDSMSKYIADSTISEMVKAEINPCKAKVAVFGFTFKENCPDMRNTKVINIVNYLNSYNCEVILTDEYADVKEAKEIYDIDLVKREKINNVDAVIIAVAHDQYHKINKKEWLTICKSPSVVMDVKKVIDENYFIESTIKYWEL